VVGIQQGLTVVRIEYAEVLVQELAHHLGASVVAQEGGLRLENPSLLGYVKGDLRRQGLPILYGFNLVMVCGVIESV